MEAEWAAPCESNLICCGIGLLGGQRPSLGGYVRGMGATAAGGGSVVILLYRAATMRSPIYK